MVLLCSTEENEQEDRWAYEKKQVQFMRGPTRAGGSLRDLENFMDAAAERVDIWMLRRWRRKCAELIVLYLDEEIKDYEGHRKYHGHRRVFDIATKLLKAHIAEKKLTDAERFAAAEAVAVRALLKHRATMKAERAAQQREEERLIAGAQVPPTYWWPR